MNGFQQSDLLYVLTLPFKMNSLYSKTKCKTNQAKGTVSPKWTFQYRWKSFEHWVSRAIPKDPTLCPEQVAYVTNSGCYIIPTLV